MSVLNRSGTRRTGDDYQDVVAIDLLLRWLGSNDEFEWFKVEADDALHLDDVTAKRSDGTLVYRQVKYSTSPQSADDPWDWEKLLDRGKSKGSRKGASLLEKWSKSLHALSGRAASIDAAVISNRRPGPSLRTCLSPDGHVQFDRIAPDVRARIAEQLGEAPAHEFFVSFRFELEFHGLKELEEGCRRRLGSLGGIEDSWYGLKEAVARWVCFKNEPRQNGRILLEDLHQAARWHGLRTIPQDFEVPADFVLASAEFRDDILSKLEEPTRRCLVLTGPPGSGKSTFTSHLFATLRAAGRAAIRHHYYLPTASDYTAYQRADHILAAESLMHDLKSDHSDALGTSAQRNPIPSPDELRAWLVEVGRYYNARGERLILILDGLDHVWRERRSAEQLSKLLGPLLPPPDGIVLLLVTQPVIDDRLPPQLLSVAPRPSWTRLRLLDRHAVRRWARRTLAINGRLGQLGGGRNRARRLRDLADGLWEHSGGHPLHLRYTLGALLDRGLALAPGSLGRLPECPSENISTYYATLWHELGQVGRDLLHLVTACGFPWPPQGLIECATYLGHSSVDAERAFREIRHLLSESDQALQPYHASLVVFLREQDGYLERRPNLLGAGLKWLKERSPESWRWAYTWPLEADLGDPAPLIGGLERSWLVRAVNDCRPAATVKALISRGLWHAADRGDLAALARISLLSDYSIAAFEFYEDLVSSFLRPLLVLDQDGSLRPEATASGRVTRRASSDPACILPRSRQRPQPV